MHNELSISNEPKAMVCRQGWAEESGRWLGHCDVSLGYYRFKISRSAIKVKLHFHAISCKLVVQLILKVT